MKGFLEAKGIGPDGNAPASFYFSKSQIEHFERTGNGEKFYEVLSAHDVLSNPTRIYQV